MSPTRNPSNNSRPTTPNSTRPAQNNPVNVAVPTRIGALGTTSPNMISPPSSFIGTNVNGQNQGANGEQGSGFRQFAIPYPPGTNGPSVPIGRSGSPLNVPGGKKTESDFLGRPALPSSGSEKDKDSLSTSSSKTLTPSGKEPRLDEEPVVLGICAMDIKARSKAMREILTRLVQIEKGGVVVKLFGDMVILEEDITHWPPVDVLISFFSTDFPLPKAIAYTQLPNPTRPPPISINSLAMQALLWDRRLVLAILDHIGVPTPGRAEVSRDGGPRVNGHLRERVRRDLGLVLPGPSAEGEDAWGPPVIPDRWVQSRGRSQNGDKKFGNIPRGKEVILREDGDAIIVDGKVLEKPFVEKPVDGEDHNVYIYFRGGGGRRLFRKVGNKSSEFDPNLIHPRTTGSFIYEEFINVDNAEDIKIYTVGPTFSHAETRKSPVVDGLVRRNADGKETRFITQLSEDERSWAKDIVEAFGQRVCGFDLLRCTREDGGTKSLIIDVNGWSFVKGNQSYYDKAAEILSNVCQTAREKKRKFADIVAAPGGASVNKPKNEQPVLSSSTLRATITVFRHADRTPKMKLKFSFPANQAWTKPFLRLLRGYREEIILRGPGQLKYIITAVDEALGSGCAPEAVSKLEQLKDMLVKKMSLPGTKAQLKPAFFKKKDKSKKKDKKDDEEGELTETETRERVKEWIEESGSMTTPTPARATLTPAPGSPDKDGQGPSGATSPLPDVGPPSNVTSPNLEPNDPPAPKRETLHPQNDSVSGTTPEEMDDEEAIPEGLEKLQLVVKWGGESTHAARYQARDLGDTFKKDLMIMNKDVLNNVKIYTSSERRVVNTAEIFARALLGKENSGSSSVGSGMAASLRKPELDDNTPLIEHLIQRRDLLDDNNAAKELTDQAKKKLKILLRPGESEKRPELAWPKSLKKEPFEVVKETVQQMSELREIMRRNFESGAVDKMLPQRWCSGDDARIVYERWQKMFDDFDEKKIEKFDPSRISELYDSLKHDGIHNRQFLFSIFNPDGKRTTQDGQTNPDRRLHELYARAKALFDLVAPQEYGIDMADKEEIGVLTSLPLLRKIVEILVEAKETSSSTAQFFFTKESHIQTFMHLLLTSGLPLLNVPLPHLDYASHLTLELYERVTGSGNKVFTIRLAASEGAHSDAVFDSSVDARHTLSVQPRYKLTSHIDFDTALACLSKHFNSSHISSTTPLEGDQVYLKREVHDEAVLPLSAFRNGDETPRHISSAASDRTHASDW